MIPWGVIIEIGLRLINLLMVGKANRDKMKMQMYEFARRFDADAVDGNAVRRKEYRKLKEELAKKDRERKNG